MLRFTAITGIWFILFLMSTSKKGTTFAAALGGLIVLGILFDAVNKSSTADLVSVIQGQPLQDSKGNTLDVTFKPKEFYESTENLPASGGTNV